MSDNISTEKLVSIAMATYNGEAFLAEQLETLVSQTYRNIEIVISDDNSSDTTRDIIQQFKSKHSNIFLHLNNPDSKGIRKNFENALKHCKGELIALADQDDVWEQHKISRLVRAVDNNILIYHDSDFINEDGRKIEGKISDNYNFYRGNDPRAFLLINCISGHSMLFRKELLDLALPLPASRYHDWWLAFVAASMGRIDFVPEALVHYRQHEKSKTDILKRRTDYQHPGADSKFNSEKEWYQRCAIQRSDQKPFFEKWYTEFLKTGTSLFNYNLLMMGLQNQRILLGMSKESLFKQKMELVKIAAGLPVKKLLL